MADITELQWLSNDRFFLGWDQFINPKRVAASEACIRQLVEDLIALWPELPENAVRAAVDACVRRFNVLDEDGWICTIEREDIYEKIGRVIDLCGFEYDEDWVAERDW